LKLNVSGSKKLLKPQNNWPNQKDITQLYIQPDLLYL